MKLPGFLNKPRWQAKEAAERRAGVAGDDDAELIASLPRIAREDPDAGVRTAALKRLADPALTQRLAQEDTDAGVRGEARKLWFELLAGTHPRSPTPTECLRLLRAQDDTALIEHIARSANDDELRSAALARVSRVSLLAERATGDAIPALRLAALERIDDEALLERLAERTRKTDKTVSRRARERAEALRIARGDNDTANARARLLCERLEQMVRVPSTESAEAEVATQWAAVEPTADEALKARYNAARALLATSREVRVAPIPVVPDDAPAEAANEPVQDAVVTEAANENADTAPADPLIANARFEASVTAAKVDKHRELQQRQERIDRIESVFLAFEAAVNDGNATQAHAAHTELGKLRKASKVPLPRSMAHRLADTERRYAELSRWQHWSDNQRRRQLCEAVEALTGSGLHPDAVATRVREAQTEWSKLDAIEGHAAGDQTHGWSRRFHAACRHAIEPAKSYFRKRQELRKSHAQTIDAALKRVQEIPEDSSDWTLIATTRRDVVECLRALDRVDPHDRKKFAKNLKNALTTLDARIAQHHSTVESAKVSLIAEAQALASAEQKRGAPAAARALQQRWREAGIGRRDRDQTQWKAFRGALDAVFGTLDEERAQRNVRDAESRTQAETLCADLETLARADEPPARSATSRIEAAWDALNVREESLIRRFRAAQSQVRDAGAKRERASRRAPYAAWLERYRLCRRAETQQETSDALRVAWDAAPAANIATAALLARFEAAMSGTAAGDEDNTDDARDILVRLEILAGAESPREDLDLRRALQIDRLSARMRGASAATPQHELAELLVRWTELAHAPSPALDARLERGLAAAIDTLP